MKVLILLKPDFFAVFKTLQIAFALSVFATLAMFNSRIVIGTEVINFLHSNISEHTTYHEQ